MDRQSYNAQRKALAARHAAAENAVAANGHRLSVWDNTCAVQRFDADAMTEGRTQVGHCACMRSGAEISTFESHNLRVWGTDIPCSRTERGGQNR